MACPTRWASYYYLHHGIKLEFRLLLARLRHNIKTKKGPSLIIFPTARGYSSMVPQKPIVLEYIRDQKVIWGWGRVCVCVCMSITKTKNDRLV